MSNSSFDTVVTAPGSLGDVNPMLGIARSLQAKGRRVLFLAAEPYLPLAQRAGLNTRILTPKEEFDRLVNVCEYLASTAWRTHLARSCSRCDA